MKHSQHTKVKLWSIKTINWICSIYLFIYNFGLQQQIGLWKATEIKQLKQRVFPNLLNATKATIET